MCRDNSKILIATITACCLFVTNHRAVAGIIIDTPSANIDSGGTGFIDVLVSTTDGDNLAAAFYEYTISTVSGGSALTITSIEGGFAGSVFGNYVFAGTDHFGQELDPGTTLPGSTFIASDALDLDAGVSATNLLLTRIHFEHLPGPGGAAGAVGDQFHLTLVDDANTGFDDDVFDPLSIDPASFESALITITEGATAVPEPAAFSMVLFAAMGLLTTRRRSPMPK